MRISVDEMDPGYDPKWHCTDVEIFLDGKKVDCPITADTEEGYVKYFSKLPSKGGQFAEMYGKVEIRGIPLT